MKKDQIVDVAFVENNQIATEKPLIFYIHYSKRDTLTQNEIEVLSAIRESNFDICLVMNSSQPRERTASEILINYSDFLSALILRNNVGYDLGAYRDSFQNFTARGIITDSTKVFIMNNSIFWFPKSVGPYLIKLSRMDADVIASSISRQHTPHMQTFLFGSLTRDGNLALNQWLGTIKNWHFKRTIVSFGEMRSLRYLQRTILVKSFPAESDLLTSMIEKLIAKEKKGHSRDISKKTFTRLTTNQSFYNAGIPFNPSQSFWLENIELGFPGIKIDFLKSNPSNVADYNLALSICKKEGMDPENLAQILLRNKTKSLYVKLRMRMKI